MTMDKMENKSRPSLAKMKIIDIDTLILELKDLKAQGKRKLDYKLTINYGLFGPQETRRINRALRILVKYRNWLESLSKNKRI
jgi:hypothetical protein